MEQFDRPTMTPSEALAVARAEASYTELCAAIREPDQRWEDVERLPQAKRLRAVVNYLSAAVAENERLREALLDAQNRLSEIERNLGVASEDYYTCALTPEGQADACNIRALVYADTAKGASDAS